MGLEDERGSQFTSLASGAGVLANGRGENILSLTQGLLAAWDHLEFGEPLARPRLEIDPLDLELYVIRKLMFEKIEGIYTLHWLL
ncbi:hypothetical protein RRG08_002661 [Elysia crispata]|uniref:Uncharacterized protein n=1 Tax=Elysia crispata TaxID=231223 RepID=A0AAE1CMA1_9GAST|nr:hypothetical protein RRG08_002661 [Elysia crispata]